MLLLIRLFSGWLRYPGIWLMHVCFLVPFLCFREPRSFACRSRNSLSLSFGLTPLIARDAWPLIFWVGIRCRLCISTFSAVLDFSIYVIVWSRMRFDFVGLPHFVRSSCQLFVPVPVFFLPHCAPKHSSRFCSCVAYVLRFLVTQEKLLLCFSNQSPSSTSSR